MKQYRNHRKTHFATAAILALAALAGCAVHPDDNADDNERRLLEAHVGLHYPNAQASPSGLYFIDVRAGAGVQPQPLDYLYVNYTAYDLYGNVLTSGSAANSNSDSIARQLGVFTDSTYYGPRLWSVGRATLYAGLEETVYAMRAGGKARAIIPSWLTTVGESDRQLTATAIFDVELLEIVSDITEYEKAAVQTYNQTHHNVASDDDNWFLATLTPGDGNVAALGDTFHLWYVGYLLDGFVFDTNIADSARYHRIFNASKTYEKMSVVYAEEMSLVDGFKKALEKMKPGEEAVAFFTSDLGYKDAGSGQIQAFTPLRFYIRMERIGLATAAD